jgi:hypothetical protein
MNSTTNNLEDTIPPPQNHWVAVALAVERLEYRKGVKATKPEEDYWSHRFLCRGNDLKS